jgi:hypothetical protein
VERVLTKIFIFSMFVLQNSLVVYELKISLMFIKCHLSPLLFYEIKKLFFSMFIV